MPNAELGAATIHYQSAGEGDPVVLVPGFVTTLRLFDGQMEALSRRHRAVRYDLRGQGESSAPADGYAVSDHAADLGALIEHLNLSRAHLVGASLGGAVAVHFAIRHPEHVRSLTLAGAVVDGFPNWPADYLERMRRARKVGRTEGPEAAMRDWLTHPFFGGARDLARLSSSAVRASASVWTGAARAPPEGPSDWQRLEELAMPTLVTVGDREVPPVLEAAQALRTRVPGAAFQVIQGAGHLPAWDQPEDFTRVLLDFLARVARR